MKKTCKWIVAIAMVLIFFHFGMLIQKEEVLAAENWYEDYEYMLIPTDENVGTLSFA